MTSQDDSLQYAESQPEAAETGDYFAVARPRYHPCPFCGGVIVGRSCAPQSAMRFECSQCVTVILFPPDPAASMVQ